MLRCSNQCPEERVSGVPAHDLHPGPDQRQEADPKKVCKAVPTEKCIKIPRQINKDNKDADKTLPLVIMPPPPATLPHPPPMATDAASLQGSRPQTMSSMSTPGGVITGLSPGTLILRNRRLRTRRISLIRSK